MNKKKDRVIPFRDSRKESRKDGKDILIKGNISTKLKYEVHETGIILIHDGVLTFKKDLREFESQLQRLDFNTLKENETFMIKGSGANDHLVFCKKEGDIKITLEKRMFSIIETLYNIIKEGKTATL